MADDVAYILADSDSRVVFAEDDEQVAKLREKHSELPRSCKVVVFDGTDRRRLGHQLRRPRDARREVPRRPPRRRRRARRRDRAGDSLATLIYTSGTTGRPKGVRLRHDGWVYEGDVIAAPDILAEDDLQFLWLPMAHSFGKVLLTTQLAIGFPTAIDGRVPKIVDNLGGRASRRSWAPRRASSRRPTAASSA